MSIKPYLFFDGRCEEALGFYKSAIAAEVPFLLRMKDSPEPESCGNGLGEKILHATFKIGDTIVMASDGHCAMKPEFKGFALSLYARDAAEVDRYLAALGAGGAVVMPASKTFFADRFGMVTDKFGVTWMVIAEAPGAAAAKVEPFVISREFDKPRDLVFAAFSDPERMRHWWGPKGAKVIVSKMDFRPGGTYHYGLEYGGGKMWGKFAYGEIERPSRIDLVSSFSDENAGVTRHPMAPEWPLQMHSTFTFEEAGASRTKVTIAWAPIDPSAAEREAFEKGRGSMQQGWSGTFEQLEAYLASA